MEQFLLFLTLTMILEAPFYLFLLRHRRRKERVVFWLTANVYSYPPVFFIFPHLPLPAVVCELGAELWAPLCEIAVGAILLQQFGRRETAVVVAANLFSWAAGKALLKTGLLWSLI